VTPWRPLLRGIACCVAAVLCPRSAIGAETPPASLVVTTAPPGAKVRVDGYLKGVTPAEVRVSAARWAPTRHRLTLDLDGHERSDEVLWLRAGEDRVVRRGLRKRVDMPALLAGFVPPGPVLEGYAAANLDADGDTELVVLAADPAGNATLVVYDVREDVLAECYRVAVGAQPRSLLPVEDLTGDLIPEVLCLSAGGKADRVLTIVAARPAGGPFGVICRCSCTAAGWRLCDVNGDGVAEVLFSSPASSPVSGTMAGSSPSPQWRLLHWDGGEFVESPSFPGAALRPSEPFLCRSERVERLAESPWSGLEPLLPLPGRAADTASGRFAASWDSSKHLILSIEVVDGNVVQTEVGTRAVAGDHVEVWIDRDLAGDFAERVPDADDVCLLLSPGDFMGMPAEVALLRPETRTVANARIESERTANGYRLLAYLPHSVTGLRPPTEGAAVGFAVAVYNRDTPGKPPAKPVLANSGGYLETDCTTFLSLVFVGD